MSADGDRERRELRLNVTECCDAYRRRYPVSNLTKQDHTADPYKISYGQIGHINTAVAGPKIRPVENQPKDAPNPKYCGHRSHPTAADVRHPLTPLSEIASIGQFAIGEELRLFDLAKRISGDIAMLRTPLCDLYGIDVPIILAPMGTCTSAELAAAVSNAGGLGGIGSLFRTTAAIKRDIETVKKLTNRHFAINHIPQTLDAEAFRYTLSAQPAVISFALGDPGDLVQQAHDVGSLVMLQVTTVAQAVQAAKRGVDVIIAQGGEAGGYSGDVSTMALVPQVVDAVSPIPVVAAGGIFDGRGIAAALMMGASGVNLGTRFIATLEAPVPEAWKQAIVGAKSEDAIKVDVLNDISPLPGTAGFGTVLRSLHTDFLDEWSAKRDEARRERDRLRNEIVSTTQAGRPDATLLTAGQTAGGIKDIPPVAEVIRRLVAETEAALKNARNLFVAP